MEFENKKLRDVADVAARIMMGEKALHPNQQKLDVHEPEKDELTAKDFEMLRNKKKVKEETEETIEEGTPAKNTDVADKSYLKDMGKKPTVASDLKNLGRFITGKKETNEEVELAEDNLGAIAKKHGMELKRTTYGAGMKHPTHGEVSINRYGEWNHKGKTGNSSNNFSSLDKHLTSLKEEVEELEEADIEKTATGVKVYGSSYGNSQRARREQIKKDVDTIKGPKMKDIASIEAEKKTKKKFSEMVESFSTGGIKSLFASLVKEEPTNDEFKKELDDQQAKSEGKKKQPDLAKGSVQAVKNEEVEQLDELSPGTLKSYVNKAKPEVKAAKAERADARDAGDGKTANDAFQMAKKRTAGIKQAKAKLNKEDTQEVEVVMDELNGYAEATIEERSMTEPEMKKKEEIVKSMKKGLSGFKERYGKDAKSVMYATATKQAMKEETEDHFDKGYQHAMDHALDSGNRETARHRKPEMLANNPHKKGTPEHNEWHKGAKQGHSDAMDEL